MKPGELRQLTIDELKRKELDLRKELFNLRLRLVTGEIENPRMVRTIKRDIARTLTVITEKNRPETAG